MKLAILGNTPIALEATLRFHLHGAAVTWYNSDDLEIESLYTSVPSGPDFCTSEEGLKLLAESGKGYAPSSFQYDHWKKNYYSPLVEFLKAHHPIKPYQIVSVTKRYLGLEETIKDRSRFYDLFRIIYQINPSQFIEEQRVSNPETFQRLTDEFIQSLQSNIEMYEDFDLVLDFRHATESGSLSFNGRAMGEARVTRDKLIYGYEALMKASTFIDDSDIREVALVGSGFLAGEIIIRLGEWLRDPRNRLFVISAEASPFDECLSTSEQAFKEKLEGVFHFMEDEFKKETDEFHSKLREWQELDDFVQVKVQKPVEPIPRLNYFSGHNVSAIDQLIDKRRVFLTLEKPEFREGLKHPDNNFLELKTLGVDNVLVAGTLKKTSYIRVLQNEEVGFFDFKNSVPPMTRSWQKDLNELKGIEDEIFKLFSPVSPG